MLNPIRLYRLLCRRQPIFARDSFFKSFDSVRVVSLVAVKVSTA